MTLTHKQVAALIALTATISVLLSCLIMALTQPQPVQASDQQVVRAIQKTIGKYDYSGNSLRSSVHKDLQRVEDAVRDSCRAQPDTTSCGF